MSDSELQRRVAAGATAGLIETTLLQPLDVAKTRLQLQGTHSFPNDSRAYTSMQDCFSKMRKNEGIRALWKGLSPPVLTEVPRKALKITTFNEFAKMFQDNNVSKKVSYGLAGLSSGVVEALLLTPFDVVKVNLQANKGVGPDKATFLGTTSVIMRKNGIFLNGLNRGLFISILKNSIFNFVYFGSFYSVKDFFKPHKNSVLSFLQTFANGFFSAVLATVVSFPFDVVKTRMQVNPPHPCYIKYKYSYAALKAIKKKDGFGGLYRGFAARIIRLGIGGAILITVYDFAYEMFDM